MFDHMGVSYFVVVECGASRCPDTDLHVVIQGKILQEVHYRYILYQIFKVARTMKWMVVVEY